MERHYLEEVLNTNSPLILSIGGGTPCYGNNMETILNSEDAISIYLKASLKELVKRLHIDKHNRPLISHLTNEESLLELIGKHLFERSNFYSQSTKKINVDNKSTDAIVEDIILSLF